MEEFIKSTKLESEYIIEKEFDYYRKTKDLGITILKRKPV